MFTLFVLLIIIIVVSITDRICMNRLSVLILELVIVCGAGGGNKNQIFRISRRNPKPYREKKLGFEERGF